MSKMADIWIDPFWVKSFREKLCAAQATETSVSVRAFYQTVIDQLDEHRPVGPNGKHGNGPLCTETCGCYERNL